MRQRPHLVLAVILISLATTFASSTPLRAQAQTPDRPFSLPIASPPGLSTWYIEQWYGNTLDAYVLQIDQYRAGQGLHFGLDFAARCGTEVVAIADGIVSEIDAPTHGAGPHSLTIDHPDLGYASFYGHLRFTPNLFMGQRVTRGQVIAVTGDPDLICTSDPHLHLEIRNLGHSIAYNPVTLIDADWDSIALIGGGRFERNLDAPRQWVTPTDQPEVDFNSPLLNDYQHAWPPDWNYR